ncbi:hypothetical protein CS301_15445 [Bacillus velezensis]|nr:hypothetical protein CS301_15445 [Bacillus velezensis]
MNDHRDDGRSRDQSDLSHTEQNRNEQQQISHQEPELLEGPVSKEAENETAAGTEFEKTAAVKKEKKTESRLAEPDFRRHYRRRPRAWHCAKPAG